jgi:formylglycine-generating enzyme required for sulfatase activity
MKNKLFPGKIFGKAAVAAVLTFGLFPIGCASFGSLLNTAFASPTSGGGSSVSSNPAGDSGNGSFTTPAKYREMVSIPGVPLGKVNAWLSRVFIEGRVASIGNYKIAKYETTYELWKEVYDWELSHGYKWDKGTGWTPGTEGHGEENGIKTNGGLSAAVLKTRPVTNINFYNAVLWCNAYSEMSGKTPVYYTDDSYSTVYREFDTDKNDHQPVMKADANGYRLPMEAEWEYAARGADLTGKLDYAGIQGEGQLGDYAWYVVNAGESVGKNSPAYGAHPVGTKKPNGKGLYDMSGNVAEWCWDWGNSSIGTYTPEEGNPQNGVYKVIRGGSWRKEASYCSVHDRSTEHAYAGDNNDNHIGFRVVCSE